MTIPTEAQIDSALRRAGLPGLVGRAGWNARPPTRTRALTLPTPAEMFTHHSDGAAPRTVLAEHETVRSIQSYHMDARGWSDIAYNFLVAQSGRVFVGRGPARVGGGTGSPQDERGWSVCALGNYTDEEPTPAMETAFRVLWAEFVAAAPGLAANYGDRDVNASECPGDRLYRRIPWTAPDDETEEPMTPELAQALADIKTAVDKVATDAKAARRAAGLALDQLEGREHEGRPRSIRAYLKEALARRTNRTVGATDPDPTDYINPKGTR